MKVTAKLSLFSLTIILCSLCMVLNSAYPKGLSPQREKAMLAALKKAEVVTAKSEKTPPPTKPTPPLEEKAAQEKPTAPKEIPPTEKGAWTVPKGQLYTEIYNKFYWHHNQFDDRGKRVCWNFDGKYNEIRSELKLEYGLTDNFSLLFSTPYKEAHWKDDFASYTRKGIVEYWAGAKYKLFDNPFIFSIQTRGKFPADYNENDVPSLGSTTTDAEIRLLSGKSLYPLINGYVKAETGFKARNSIQANEIPYFGEFGYNLFSNLILKTTLDGIKGVRHTGRIEDYSVWTASLIFKLPHSSSVELGYGSTFAGKNTSAADEVILSLATQF